MTTAGHDRRQIAGAVLPYRSRRTDGDRVARHAPTVAYAEEGYRRGDFRFGAPDVRFTTTARAIAYLDRLNVPGDVSVWIERTQRREFVARRRVDGTWLLRDATGRFYNAAGAEVLTNEPAFSLWHDAEAEFRHADDRMWS